MADLSPVPYKDKLLRFRTLKEACTSVYIFHGPKLSKVDAYNYFGIETEFGYRFMLKKYKAACDSYDRKMLKRKTHLTREETKKATQDGSITSNSVIELLIKQDCKCKLCGLYLLAQTAKHLDHIRPMSKGGKHVLSNVQWLCAPCNLTKRDKYAG